MRSPDDVVEWAQGQWRRNWKAWLAAGDSHIKAWPLHPPTETQLAADPDSVAHWVASWRRFSVPGLDVEWVERRWIAFGRQVVPLRIVATPAAIAELAGQTSHWRRAVSAAARLQDEWPAIDLASALRASATGLAEMDEAETDRLVSVLDWLATHPDSGLWERELPVQGIDSKWWERNRSLVEPLVKAITGDRARAGRLRRGDVSFLVRLLDHSLAPGPGEFSVGVTGMQQLDLRPRAVLICENRTSVETAPPLAGVVAIHGGGVAVTRLAGVEWLAAAPLLYWGDLDSHGFRILGRLRQVLPQVRSVLMDVGTLRDHAHLTVTEPRPFHGEIGYLTAAELEALAVLRRGDLRLEQERIGRDHVRASLAEALSSASVRQCQ